MSETKHTPGPWYCDPFDTEHKFPARQLVFGGGSLLAEVAGNGKGRSGANARLIAAAPALLEALKALLEDSPYFSDADSCECGEDGAGNGGTCCHVTAHRAIRQATGEE